MTKKVKLKVILMDDNTEGYFEEGGLQAVRKADEKNAWVNYETIVKEFDTEAERQAYIEGMYDITMGCWTSYAVLDNRCKV